MWAAEVMAAGEARGAEIELGVRVALGIRVELGVRVALGVRVELGVLLSLGISTIRISNLYGLPFCLKDFSTIVLASSSFEGKKISSCGPGDNSIASELRMYSMMSPNIIVPVTAGTTLRAVRWGGGGIVTSTRHEAGAVGTDWKMSSATLTNVSPRRTETFVT